MTAIEQALRDFLAARPAHVSTALVGGMAVSSRTEPRFTRDVDLAVSVADDNEATQYIFALRQLGYEIVSTLEQLTQHRLSTIRLRRRGRGPILDLLLPRVASSPRWFATPSRSRSPLASLPMSPRSVT